MLQEYLFTSQEAQNIIAGIPHEKIEFRLYNVESNDCWVASYYISGQSFGAAQKLSIVDEEIRAYNPLVLTDEVSAYFHKVLFPLVNTLECKLRKLLYLAVAQSDDKEAKTTIVDLESKDLGTIFELLFSDVNYVKQVKAKINGMSWPFTKSEAQGIVSRVSENTRWDALFTPLAVPLLREKFFDVRRYRNDIMHAHWMS